MTMTWFVIVGMAVQVVLRIVAARWLGLVVVGDDVVGYLNPKLDTLSDVLAANIGPGAAATFAEASVGSAGIIALAAIASVLPTWPFFRIARRLTSEPIAAVAALVFITAAPFGAVYGYGFATLAGLAVALLGLNLIIEGVSTEETSMTAQIRTVAGLVAIATVPLFSLAVALPAVLIVGAYGVTLLFDEDFVPSAALLIAAPFMAGLVAWMLPLSYELGRLGLRDPLIVASLSGLLILVTWYAGRFISAPMRQFILASMITVWLLSIVSTTAFDFNIVLTRAWLWLWIPIVLVAAHAGHQLARRLTLGHAWQLGAGAMLVIFLSIGWFQSFERSALRHSTLTYGTAAAIDAYAKASAIGPGAVAVVPHSLSWHVKDRVPSAYVLAEPIDPTTDTFDPLEVKGVRYVIQRTKGGAIFADRHYNIEITFNNKGVPQ